MIDIEKTLVALRCHNKGNMCFDCPYFHRADCGRTMCMHAITIIENQRKAIATLKQKLTERNNGAMTPDEFAEKMKKIIKETGGYEETFHYEADHLMCDLLVSLGYAHGVEIFLNQPKWYQ